MVVKCTLNNDHSMFLGHEVDGDGHRHTDKRLQGVADLKEPANKKQIKPYIGYINYFCDYCRMNFVDLTAPITALSKTDVVFDWSEECQKSFDTIKEQILQRQKLYFIDYTQPIYIRCDASNMGCGAMLFQVIESGAEHSVAFASRTFTEAEQRWSTLEQELFAMFLAIRKWQPLLLGQKFYVQTDHCNILNWSKALGPKVV